MKNYSLILLTLLLILIGSSLSSCTGSSAIASSWPGLSADETTAYIAFNQHVFAINLSNGSEKWRFPRETNTKISFFATPVLTPDGQLLVGGYNNVLYSIDPATGNEIWSFTQASNRIVAPPLVAKDTIYLPTAGSHIYAIDLHGNLKWTYSGGGPFWAQPIASPDYSCIYVASMDHRIYAIDVKDGSLLWQTEKLNGSIIGTPTLSTDNKLYFGSFASELQQVDTHSHELKTLLKSEGWIWGGPVLSGEKLYFGDLEGNFYEMDVTTGKIIWSVKPDNAIVAPPLLGTNIIYFGTEVGTLYAYDFNGTPSWNKSFDANIYTTPVLAGDKILIALFKSDRLLIALDQKGNELWSYSITKK